MTEYWVSQGNKWCDFCKIYIANNPLSIRTHELGQRHKDNVAQKLATMRKENAAKEKEQKEAARALEQIEAKAKRSYQKDLAAFLETKDSGSRPGHGVPETSKSTLKDEWEYDGSSGYYYNASTGLHYDSNSGLYYSATIGKWVSQEEAYSSNQVSALDKLTPAEPKSSSKLTTTEDTHGAKPTNAPPPGRVVSTAVNPLRSVKGAPSSIAVNKRKRATEKPKSKEEEAALKAREAARKRVEDREAPLLGLYSLYHLAFPKE
ncbi:hypothetical protein H6P81_010825 [Aristolochia fimbriata]|uniref:Matrin-type domain-containing protein n=1 Tax=Aristolochia fimbriata TaxID=158543 RepID=A0AAV7EPV2_ARIFI|nr:hypothetical protein H6P81_010825 [Aristolochia fimbriata]